MGSACGGCACKFGPSIYAVIMLIAFLFVLVGTPIDMFRGKDAKSVSDSFSNKACYTMWGYKEKCYSTKYTEKLKNTYNQCKGRLGLFRAAEAFAIINIILYLLTAILAFIQLCCCRCLRWVCLALSVLGITLVITWACMAAVFHTQSDCEKVANVSSDYCLITSPQCGKFSVSSKLGAGFALIVTSWCLDIVAIPFLFIPC